MGDEHQARGTAMSDLDPVTAVRELLAARVHPLRCPGCTTGRGGCAAPDEVDDATVEAVLAGAEVTVDWHVRTSAGDLRGRWDDRDYAAEYAAHIGGTVVPRFHITLLGDRDA